jgi:hypothetical protein
MYANLEVKNMELSDDVEIEGEIALMHITGRAPGILSATAKVAHLAGKFICHFEVCSKNDFYVTEAATSDPKSCIRVAERKMLQKMGLYHPRPIVRQQAHGKTHQSFNIAG